MASGVELPAPSKLPHIVPRTIPGGSLQPEIRGAMDWGWQGLLAYSCNYTVVVIDPLTQQLVQTLDKHKALVTKVKWQRSQLDARFAYRAVLASADASGHIVIWDVKEGFFTMVLQDSWRPVSDMSWVYHTDGCGHMLLAAHPPNSLVLWDTDNGNKLWKKTYNEQILSFDLDPFDPRKLALLCPSSVLMVDDFAVAKCPSSGGTRVQLSALRSSAGGGGGAASAPTTPTYDEKSTKDKLKKKVLDLVTGDIPGPEEAALGQQECVQLSYHRARRHLLLLVFGRQVLLVDTQLGRAVGAVPADKSGSPFTQVMSCSRADALLTVCESGVAAVRTRAAGDELSYESRGHTDAPRLTRHLRLSAAALDPASEARLAVLLSDGRSLLWELGAGGGGRRPLWPWPPARLLLAGLLTPGPATPTVLRMCPPLTTKNWQEFVPRLACGTAAGALLVLDVARGCVLAELAAHSAAVAGIEWCSLTALLSWARPAPAGGGGGGARSELLLTDVRTGQSVAPRAERADSEPIGSVRVSPLKQYFIVVFREQPAELWELSSLTQLRALPASLPPLTALEWSPVHSARRRAGSGASETDGARALVKEHFVFTDPTGQMYHFSVEGNQVRDGTRIPADPAVGTVTGIGWKGEQLVLGDAEGQLCIWDLAKQLSHTVPTHRGAIRKLKFAPGRGNMKLLVLFGDGVDIWDTRTDERLSQLRSPRDGHPVHDCDWVSSDKPVLLTADNCVRVMDLELRQASSPTDLYQYREPVCHPCLMSLGSVSALEQYLFNKPVCHPCLMSLGSVSALEQYLFNSTSLSPEPVCHPCLMSLGSVSALEQYLFNSTSLSPEPVCHPCLMSLGSVSALEQYLFNSTSLSPEPVCHPCLMSLGSVSALEQYLFNKPVCHPCLMSLGSVSALEQYLFNSTSLSPEPVCHPCLMSLGSVSALEQYLFNSTSLSPEPVCHPCLMSLGSVSALEQYLFNSTSLSPEPVCHPCLMSLGSVSALEQYLFNSTSLSPEPVCHPCLMSLGSVSALEQYLFNKPVCHPCLMSLGSVSALEQYLFNSTSLPSEPVCHPCLMSLGSVSALEQYLFNSTSLSPEPVCHPCLMSLGSVSALEQYLFNSTSLSPEPVCHPCLMSLGSVSALEQYLFNAGEGDYTGDDRGVCQFLQTLPADLLAWLRAVDTPPEQRGLVAAHLLGNESAARLWRLACHHLSRRRPSADGKYTDFIGPDFDLLCDSEMYLEQLRDRVALRLGQWPAAGAADEVTRQLVALGQPERAAQLLLETEPADTGFYTNCLRACVLTSGPRAGDGSGVAKLVATSLIAAGHVHKGVEILVVAGQAADGCRYLQASGLWEEALLLARCRLAAADAAAVIGKHADHLISVGREREAVLFLISAEQFPRAAELVRRRDAPLHRILETVAARG
ncbi:WD repeat-containing protein 11-like [Amphibalanus amphitrite]|uniref:WD repeat-containing protein 11-like n=1 Tax=Amphibalanus amphitrite TaxID=1232801 RepID=UPI001C901493|nr:WD repeat-containing protein 11-like [Amphibalanus amphitrite]